MFNSSAKTFSLIRVPAGISPRMMVFETLHKSERLMFCFVLNQDFFNGFNYITHLFSSFLMIPLKK